MSAPLRSAESIAVADLAGLGDSYAAEKNHFMSYFFYSSAFKLSKDSALAVSCGFKALRSAILAERVLESSLLERELTARFPDLKDHAGSYYQYHLVRRKDFKTLSELSDSIANNESQLFLQAYAAFVLGKPARRDSLLERISGFPLQHEVESIRQDLRLENQQPHKSKFLAGAISSMLPGAGQIYSGSLFDGLTSFGFCSISGLAAYSSWSYEMTKNRADRNYTLPVYASLGFAVFYIANIYNAVNSAEHYNLFMQKKYMEKISKSFEMILSDDKLFLKFSF